MFSVKGKILEVKAAVGKGPRKVVIMSDDGMYRKEYLDVMDHERVLTLQKVEELPVTPKINSYVNKKGLTVTRIQYTVWGKKK